MTGTAETDAVAVAGSLPTPVEAVLLVLLLVAACVWIGGWASLLVVSRSTAATLDPAARVAFFRHHGRLYGIVSTVALVVGLGTGLVLLIAMPWTGVSTALVVLAVVLVLTLGLGVVQARRLTRDRTRLQREGRDAALVSGIRARARAAFALRLALGVLSIGVLVLAVVHAV